MTEPAQTPQVSKVNAVSIIDAIANLGPRPIAMDDETYTFNKTDLDRMVDIDAPHPTDGADPKIVNQYFSKLSRRELFAEIEIAMKQFADDFQYPVNSKGQPLDLRFLTPHIGWHLLRCGWRPIANRRMIKKVAIGAGPQRMDDAVAWVDINTPDEIDPSKLTIDQLKAAPAHVQAEAIRRLNGDPKPPPATASGRPGELGREGYETWHQPWAIDADGDPDFKKLMDQRQRNLNPNEGNPDRRGNTS